VQLGASFAAPTVAAIAAAATAPATRRFFRDARVLGVERPAYEIGLRIPIGTALSEELIFRGALLGLFRMHHSTPVAIAMSSALFGIWHVLPTLEDPDPGTELRSVATAVAVTTAAGCLFAWMRVRTGSLAAPVLVHAAVNVTAFAAVRLLGRYDRRAR
jgi:membrane protease YdiL (CAAX protease family)